MSRKHPKATRNQTNRRQADEYIDAVRKGRQPPLINSKAKHIIYMSDPVFFACFSPSQMKARRAATTTPGSVIKVRVKVEVVVSRYFLLSFHLLKLIREEERHNFRHAHKRKPCFSCMLHRYYIRVARGGNDQGEIMTYLAPQEVATAAMQCGYQSYDFAA